MKRLEKEVKKTQSDNGFLFNENKKLNKDKEKYDKMSRIYSLFKEREPEAFARTFYRASSLFDVFIPQDEPVANIGKSRLRQIEKENEKENTTKYQKENNNSSKAD